MIKLIIVQLLNMFIDIYCYKKLKFIYTLDYNVA